MALIVFNDAHVTVNGVNLSDHVKSVKLSYSAAMLDDTVMGDTTKSNLAGLKEWSIEVEFVQDYAASNVDATLFPLVGAAAFTITIKPTSAAVSATNPSFSGSAVLPSYEPLNASGVGELGTAAVQFLCAGNLTRATA